MTATYTAATRHATVGALFGTGVARHRRRQRRHPGRRRRGHAVGISLDIGGAPDPGPRASAR